MKPQCVRMLSWLADGAWHSAAEMMNAHPPIMAVSQRVTDLRRLGYDIDSTGAGGHELARYRLSTVPDVTTYDGALFEVEEARPHTAA